MTQSRIVTAPGVRPVMQVAVGDIETPTAVYDVSRYDQARYDDLDADWFDDTCDVIDATTYYGRQRTSDVFDVGTATLRVANPDGLWDYPATSDLTPLQLRPGRQIRVGVVVDGSAPHWLWHGWIDGTEPGYDPAVGDVVTVTAICAKGESGRVEAAKLAEPLPNETATSRMVRLANEAGFPAHRRRFAESSTMLAGTQMGQMIGQLFDMAAASSGGDVYGDDDGFLVYRNRDWQTYGPDKTPDGYIGNRGVTGEVCPNAWEVSFLRSDFTNRVLYGRRTDAVPQQMNDTVGQAKFGIETYKLTVDTIDEAELDNLGFRIMRTRSFNLAPRIGACTLDAARPGVADLLASASPFAPSMYVCGHVTRDGRPAFTRTMYLTGIEHTIDAAQWIGRLQLDDAAPWQVSADTRYDAAHYDADRYTKVA
jgi:hypothetical protein